MLPCQRHLFSLPKEVSYINCAYMAPLLKTVEQAGIKGVQGKSLPYQVGATDFFEHALRLKSLFSKLINNDDDDRIAIIPSVSYGVANAVKNIPIKQGDEILVVEGQFPSNIYSWKEIATANGAAIKTAAPPKQSTDRAKQWNEQILAAITAKTAVVAIGIVHWADGTLFDLKAIREKTTQHNALLIIDGTQSVGALPFDVQEIKPDALICAGYKWLLGPYSYGLAYYGPAFDDGQPIEENWIIRKDSDDFKNLVNYQDEYRVKANRYSVGEYSNFILMPMLEKALEQLLDWGVPAIQEYCGSVFNPFVDSFQELGCEVEVAAWRANHLVGVRLPERIDIRRLKEQLDQERIFVSLRGNAVRISPHVYNTAGDMERLVGLLKGVLG